MYDFAHQTKGVCVSTHDAILQAESLPTDGCSIAPLPISELTSGDNMGSYRQDPIFIILFITSEFTEAQDGLQYNTR